MKSRKESSAADTGIACPCGSDRPYARCCGIYHAGASAADADALMRSRYSAYVRELEPYLLATWHVSMRPPAVRFEAGTRWLGLKVLRREQIDEAHAMVEFVARYRLGGSPAVRLHEISRFVREDGRWYYVDGHFPEGGRADR
jgi:SEC-C motif-containing protein